MGNNNWKVLMLRPIKLLMILMLS